MSISTILFWCQSSCFVCALEHMWTCSGETKQYTKREKACPLSWTTKIDAFCFVYTYNMIYKYIYWMFRYYTVAELLLCIYRAFFSPYTIFVYLCVFVRVSTRSRVCVGKHCSRGEAGSKHVRGTRARVAKELFVLLFISATAAVRLQRTCLPVLCDWQRWRWTRAGRPANPPPIYTEDYNFYIYIYTIVCRGFLLLLFFFLLFMTPRDIIFHSVILFRLFMIIIIINTIHPLQIIQKLYQNLIYTYFQWCYVICINMFRACLFGSPEVYYV